MRLANEAHDVDVRGGREIADDEGFAAHAARREAQRGQIFDVNAGQDVGAIAGDGA